MTDYDREPGDRENVLYVTDRNTSREDERILATVPRRTELRQYGRERLDPETYRQALKVVLGTPEIEGHLDAITASMLVAIFGTWLAAKMVWSRVFGFFVDILLLFATLSLAGFLIGVMLGEGILPAQTANVVLIASAGLALVLAGVVLGVLVRGVEHGAPRAGRESAAAKIVVNAEDRRSHASDA